MGGLGHIHQGPTGTGGGIITPYTGGGVTLSTTTTGDGLAYAMSISPGDHEFDFDIAGSSADYLLTITEGNNLLASTTIPTSTTGIIAVPFTVPGGVTSISVGIGSTTSGAGTLSLLGHWHVTPRIDTVNVLTSVCSGEKYPYGYNTQMKVNEIAGIGNHTTAKFWELDTRTGRRWNLDPVDQINISNYVVNRDNPILLNDPKGDCPWCVGLVIGFVAELGSQIITNYVTGQDPWNIDWVDVGVSTLEGGLTAGASASKTIGLKVGAAVIRTAVDYKPTEKKDQLQIAGVNKKVSDVAIDGVGEVFSFVPGLATDWTGDQIEELIARRLTRNVTKIGVQSGMGLFSGSALGVMKEDVKTSKDGWIDQNNNSTSSMPDFIIRAPKGNQKQKSFKSDNNNNKEDRIENKEARRNERASEKAWSK